MSAALQKGHEVMEAHAQELVGGYIPHSPQEVGVMWSAKCWWDGTRIAGWNQEGMAQHLMEHIHSPEHVAAAEHRANWGAYAARPSGGR